MTLERDGAAVFVDDAATDPEAESRSSLALGGEEWLEEMGPDVVGDAGAVVGDGDDCACRLFFRSIGGCGLRHEGHGYFAARTGCFRRVGDEVGEDLAQFRWESRDA